MGSDLSPYRSKIHWKIDKWAGGGYRATAKLRINYRWDTECEWIETNRIFGHKHKLTLKEFKKECLTSLQDLIDKIDFAYQANHGMLDTKDRTIRFKA